MRAIAVIYTILFVAIAANSNLGRGLAAQILLKEPLQQTYEITPSPYGEQFDSLLVESALEIGVPTMWLVRIFEFESSYNYRAVNKPSGAFGLIQFLPSTLAGLGSSAEELYKLPAAAQLPLVVKYYQGQQFNDLTTMRLFTFYPAAVGKDETWPIGNRLVARQNKIYDLDGSGIITVGEFYEYYRLNP